MANAIANEIAAEKRAAMPCAFAATEGSSGANRKPEAVTLGRSLTALGAVAVLGIGTGALIWPRQSTRTYGIPDDAPSTHAYVRATAARDLVMGAFVLWAAAANDRGAMLAGLLACSVAPAADLLLALRRSGAVPQLAIHAAGVGGVLGTWAVLRAERP